MSCVIRCEVKSLVRWHGAVFWQYCVILWFCYFFGVESAFRLL